jgi:DNA (cytosine-5)-methyltransferase 1
VSLVLSLFPGIGLLDRAFELEGFCVVRGPDLLWGGDIKTFHPPAGVFDGVIGGPPCQKFSGLANFAHRWKHQPEDLIPEFERCVREAAPAWFVMENVPGAPLPEHTGFFTLHDVLLNNRQFGAAQDRERRISFGSRNGTRLDRHLAQEIQRSPIAGEYSRTVTASHGGGRQRMKGTIESLSVEVALERQGLPTDFFDRSPFKRSGQLKMLAQGVPLPMGRAIAKAVKRALGLMEARP